MWMRLAGLGVPCNFWTTCQCPFRPLRSNIQSCLFVFASEHKLIRFFFARLLPFQLATIWSATTIFSKRVHIKEYVFKAEVDAWLKKNLVTIKGSNVANPLLTFEEANFPGICIYCFLLSCIMTFATGVLGVKHLKMLSSIGPRHTQDRKLGEGSRAGQGLIL